MKVNRDTEFSHPLLIRSINKIEVEIIQKYNFPFKRFETSRNQERHQQLLNKGKTRDPVSMHLYDFSSDPPKYSTAVDYVHYDGKWSWNLRDSTISAWYILFGNLVLDCCSELYWAGTYRRSVNLTHFELRQSVIFDSIDEIPCVIK